MRGDLSAAKKQKQNDKQNYSAPGYNSSEQSFPNIWWQNWQTPHNL